MTLCHSQFTSIANIPFANTIRSSAIIKSSLGKNALDFV